MLSETLYNYLIAETCKFGKLMKIHEFKWNRDCGKEGPILDVGCGVTQISTDFISQKYANAEKIYIDKDPGVIGYFNRKNKKQYLEADILNWDSLESMEGTISKVVSLRCLSEIENQKEAFRNIFRILRYGGDILVLLTINSYFYDLVNTVLQRDRWRFYFKGKYAIPESHTKSFKADHYRNLLHSAGFVQITIVEMPRIVTYRDAFDFKDDVYNSSLCKYVPGEYRQEFANEVLLCAQLNRFKNDPFGYLDIEYNTLWLHAGKMAPLKKRPYPL